MSKTRYKPKKLDIKKILPLFFAILAVVILIISLAHKAENSSITPSREELLVFLDAGHGGNDNGSSSDDGRMEKDDTLKITLAVQDELNARGVRTQMSRSTDEYMHLDKRWQMANESKAALFISIHRNSASEGKGVEIWVESSKPKEDTLLAENILKGIEKVGISGNRGVRFGYMGNASSDYAVNKGSEMPSCLVELGFITNEEDNALFDKNYKEYAKAIAQGIVDTATKLNLAKAV